MRLAVTLILLIVLIIGVDAMAYGLHVVKSNDMGSAEKIDLESWMEYIDTHPNFSLQNAYEEVTSSGIKIMIPSEALGVWTDPVTGAKLYFEYRNGELAFSYTEYAIEIAREIADSLEAFIVGDEGELY